MTGYLWRGQPGLASVNAQIMAERSRPPETQPPRPPKPRIKRGTAKCGTYAGHAAHLRRHEDPCGPCEAAHKEYQATYRIRRNRRAGREAGAA